MNTDGTSIANMRIMMKILTKSVSTILGLSACAVATLVIALALALLLVG